MLISEVSERGSEGADDCITGTRVGGRFDEREGRGLTPGGKCGCPGFDVFDVFPIFVATCIKVTKELGSNSIELMP